ncbi:Lrp/AsnC family transcriptional regulator [Rhodocaloribacter litoris]|uniref:Lrp/AsnC family transcriptional regulator n=1 Tax=Rhodocaloribacter litoris TaxID=2558931 RepID=UPI00141FA01A|nr:Lrp/AsnC family transcriptional regulator [Rhodocaloribacter litoris]QXD16831.1 Lrp/AsnC family transcriptional regulator [Rhodocaloribacter litoris]
MLESLDHIDRQILDILQEDGGITNVELARRVGLAPATTLDRVKKLRQRGVIRGYVALVDPSKVNQGTIAFVQVTLNAHGADFVQAFREQVQTLPEVLECYHISGESDYLLKVVAPNIQQYEDFLLHKLASIPNIGKIHTSFVLSTVKHATKIPVQMPD